MAERIETINDLLRQHFGISTETTDPIFRVVWSDDQTEKRETKYTDAGIELLTPEVRELPKYPWIKHMYVLERLVVVPDASIKELAAKKLSYEPVWVFQDQHGFPLPPRFDACKFVIDTLYAALGKKSMAAYKDNPPSISNAQEAYEARKTEIDDLQNRLFGDESGLNQQTINASGSGIIVPSNYKEH